MFAAAQLGNEKGGKVDKIPTTHIRDRGETSRIRGNGVVGVLGGGLKKTISELSKLITKREIVMRTVSKMQKTILMNSESIIRKVMSGLVQGVEEET